MCSTRTTLIVLDSSALYGDLLLQSADTLDLLCFSKHLGITVAIPKVVSIELVQHGYDDHLHTRQEIEQLAQKNLRRGISIPGLEVHPHPTWRKSDEDAEYFSKSIADRFKYLEQSGYIRILSIPDIPHEAAVRRACEGKRPFKASFKNGKRTEKDNGYRDYLIWISTAIASCDFDDIYFVTKNTRDFSDSDSIDRTIASTPQLHRDLLDDIENDKKIILSSNISEVMTRLSINTKKLPSELVDFYKLRHRVEPLGHNGTVRAVESLLFKDEFLRIQDPTHPGSTLLLAPPKGSSICEVLSYVPVPPHTYRVKYLSRLTFPIIESNEQDPISEIMLLIYFDLLFDKYAFSHNGSVYKAFEVSIILPESIKSAAGDCDLQASVNHHSGQWRSLRINYPEVRKDLPSMNATWDAPITLLSNE